MFKLLGYGLLAVVTLSASFFRPISAAERAGALAPRAVIRRVAAPRIRAVIAAPRVRAVTERAAHGPTYTVTATAYAAVLGQTDDEPFVTADNSTIPSDYSSRLRWLALSHDLLARWGGPFAYGDQVRVTGLSSVLDGVYTVHDTMNRRHHHCLDVLSSPGEHFDVFCKGVKIRNLSR